MNTLRRRCICTCASAFAIVRSQRNRAKMMFVLQHTSQRRLRMRRNYPGTRARHILGIVLFSRQLENICQLNGHVDAKILLVNY